MKSEYRFAEKPRTSGFTAVANALIYDESLSPAARLLYQMLYDSATFTHEQPGQAQIAKKLCCTDKTLRKYVEELVAAGLLEVDRRGNAQTNLYTVYTTDNRAPTLNGKNDRSLADDPDRSFLPTVNGKNDRSPRACDSLSRKTSTNTETPAESPAETTSTTPPKLVKVDGQNLAFNALKDATGAGHGEDRKIAAALNGRGGQTGIRTFFAAEHPPTDEDQTRWEAALADEIYRRARHYREVMPPGSMLTPTALCAWWGRLTTSTAAGGSRGMTEEDRAIVPQAVAALRSRLG